MPTGEKFRILLGTEEGTHHPLLWFKGHKRDEIFWGPYGLGTPQSTLRAEWLERRSPLDSHKTQRYHVAGYTERNLRFDHFSSHCDGTFHLKCIGTDKPIYVHILRRTLPIGEKSDIFLECVTQTGLIEAYARSVAVRNHDRVIPVPRNRGIQLYFAVAGSGYPLRDEISRFLKPGAELGPAFDIGNFTLASMYSMKAPPAPSRYPPLAGTVVSLRFETTAKSYRNKMFIFQ